MGLTDEQRQAACEYGRRSAREQGLPEMLEDPATYAELGRLFATAKPTHPCPTCGTPCIRAFCSIACVPTDERGGPAEEQQ